MTSRLELQVQEKARSLLPTGPNKPSAFPSLDTVQTGINISKSQGQVDHI